MFDKYRCTVSGCRYSSNSLGLATRHIVRHEADRERERSRRAAARTAKRGGCEMSKIELRPFQKEAADFLLASILDGGRSTFKSPIGVGRTLIVIDAAKRFPGNVAIVSRHRLIREQYRTMADKSGATNITITDLRVDPAAFLAIILDSEFDQLDAGQTPVVTLGHP